MDNSTFIMQSKGIAFFKSNKKYELYYSCDNQDYYMILEFEEPHVENNYDDVFSKN